MASISTTIQLYDKISAPINNMISALDNLCGAYERIDKSMDTGFDVSSIESARQSIDAAARQVAGVGQGIEDNVQHQENYNRSVQNGTSQMDGLLKKVTSVVAAYATIQTVEKVLDISDELTQTKARLNLMNDGLQTTDELLEMVYRSAQNARGSFGDMAAIVAKFGNNAGDAFSSSEEVVAFANLVQKQMTIAGASTAEASNAMLQLSQALGSGTLRGDELNSIFEQAPNLIQSIADYLDVPIGKIREMASEGEISASIVKSAIFAAADDINATFEQMPMTWGQIWTNMKNGALMQFQPVLQKVNELANNPSFQAFAANAVGAVATIAGVLLDIFELVASIGNFISENWSIISPIIMGIVTALGAYLIISGIVNTINGIIAISESVKAAAQMMATGTTFAETAAQQGLNAALLACPLTWIIMLIIALIAIIYAVCAAVAKFTGIANSGFGVITGGINVVIQFFKNLGLTVANIALGIGQAIAALGSNIMTAFHNAICSVQSWWYDLLSTCLSVIESICKALNKLPFVSFDYSGISSAADEYAAKASEAAGNKEDYESIGDAFNKGMSTFDTFQDGWANKAYKSGASWGDGVADKVSGAIDGLFNGNGGIDTSNMFNGGGYDYSGYNANQGYDSSQVPSNIADIASNTGKAADSLDITSEELKYMRDIAERDTVNRFTTAEIKVEMNNNNNINKDMDLDGIVDYLATGVNNAMEKAAEGVHV